MALQLAVVVMLQLVVVVSLLLLPLMMEEASLSVAVVLSLPVVLLLLLLSLMVDEASMSVVVVLPIGMVETSLCQRRGRGPPPTESTCELFAFLDVKWLLQVEMPPSFRTKISSDALF